jgi:hypothetical protein
MVALEPVLNHLNEFHNVASHFFITEELDVRVLEYVFYHCVGPWILREVLCDLS